MYWLSGSWLGKATCSLIQKKHLDESCHGFSKNATDADKNTASGVFNIMHYDSLDRKSVV